MQFITGPPAPGQKLRPLFLSRPSGAALPVAWGSQLLLQSTWLGPLTFECLKRHLAVRKVLWGPQQAASRSPGKAPLDGGHGWGSLAPCSCPSVPRENSLTWCSRCCPGFSSLVIGYCEIKAIAPQSPNSAPDKPAPGGPCMGACGPRAVPGPRQHGGRREEAREECRLRSRVPLKSLCFHFFPFPWTHPASPWLNIPVLP